VLRYEHIVRLQELGDCFRDAGRFEEARTVDREASTEKSEFGKANELGGEQFLTARRFAEAERSFRETLNIQMKVYRQEHITMCPDLRGLANALAGQGRDADGEPLLRQVMRLTRTSYGDLHINVAYAQIDLARCLMRLGKKDEAETLARQGQNVAERALGPGHPWLPIVYQKIAPLLGQCGRQDDAEALLRNAWTLDRARFPANHPRLMDSALFYAAHLFERHRFSEAEVVLRELDNQYRKELPELAWRRAVVDVRLGSVLASQRRFDESERLLLRGNATLALGFDPPDPRLAESRTQLAQLYDAWGKPEKAKPFR
jgi:tetratricopeptide (TPR) repeat protein